MRPIIAWFVHNPVAANLLMLIFVGGGLLSLSNIYQEEFPNIDFDTIRISVPYLGASPAEVEEAVCVRVEEKIEGTNGIDRITSTASEGICLVTVELLADTDSSAVSSEIKGLVDSIDTFPVETEKPVVSELVMRSNVVQIAVSGNAEERVLKRIGQDLRDGIAAHPNISQVDLSYSRPDEISIEVSESTLRRYGLTLSQVSDVIRQTSLDMPGGSVKTENGEILLRTKGQAYRGREFENIVVLTRPDGTEIRLGQIAKIIDGFEDTDLRARFDSKPAVLVKVYRVGKEDALEIAEAVKAYVAHAKKQLP
ncbi:MAG: efflux RND transporter permease subunit, partial [Pseudomonadota bacterium]